VTQPSAVRDVAPDLVTVLGRTRTESGRTLLELVDERPVLLVFLRHFGCAFCRQAIDDVSKVRGKLAERGVQVVFVHLGSPGRAKPYFDYYGLTDVERVSDPDGSLYREPAFALARVSLVQLFRPAVWIGWLKGAMFKYRIGLLKEDIQRMPGVFFLRDRAIANVFRHRTIADRPDYLGLAR
jgi:peroxiredoxin